MPLYILLLFLTLIINKSVINNRCHNIINLNSNLKEMNKLDYLAQKEEELRKLNEQLE